MAEPRYDIPEGVGRFLLGERFGQQFSDPSAQGIGSLPASEQVMMSNAANSVATPGYDPATATFGAQNTADIGFPSTADFAISQAIGLDERAMEDLQNYYERTGTGPNLSTTTDPGGNFGNIYPTLPVSQTEIEVSPTNYTPVAPNPPPPTFTVPAYNPTMPIDQVAYGPSPASPLYSPTLTSGIFSGG